MNKKGIGWNHALYALIALVVLASLIWLFYPKIQVLVNSIKEIITIPKK